MTDVRTTEYRPTSVSAPGETLLDLIDEQGLTQAELARRLNRPLKTINEIIKGKAAIVPDTALQLERALGVPADFWLVRESRYREWIARQDADETLKADAGWLKELPLKEMIAHRWVEHAADRIEMMRRCLAFFGVASTEAWRATYEEPLAVYRASAKVKKQPGAVAAWLRQGEREAAQVECAPFNAESFREALGPIRALTCERDPERFVPALTNLCRAAGVVTLFVPAPKGCAASGAARWLAPNKALIQLSLRYKTNDQLWFTFFHEAGHILLHGRSLVFVEHVGEGVQDEREDQANAFARDLLIPPSDAARLQTLPLSAAAVTAYAKAVGIAAGIVVGRLQNERRLPWSHLNGLKVSYEWQDTI
jgi:addiction module HigA family antidote